MKIIKRFFAKFLQAAVKSSSFPIRYLFSKVLMLELYLENKFSVVSSRVTIAARKPFVKTPLAVELQSRRKQF